LVALRGRFGTFYAYDPDARTPRGAASGTPIVSGASQTGNSLVTSGWTTDVTGILKAGDYIEVGARYYMVVEDANSDGGGAATLSVEPHLRESPGDTVSIVTTNPKVTMRLSGNEVSWDTDQLSLFGLNFAAIEAL
jgi:hypothetical protein